MSLSQHIAGENEWKQNDAVYLIQFLTSWSMFCLNWPWADQSPVCAGHHQWWSVGNPPSLCLLLQKEFMKTELPGSQNCGRLQHLWMEETIWDSYIQFYSSLKPSRLTVVNCRFLFFFTLSFFTLTNTVLIKQRQIQMARKDRHHREEPEWV